MPHHPRSDHLYYSDIGVNAKAQHELGEITLELERIVVELGTVRGDTGTAVSVPGTR